MLSNIKYYINIIVILFQIVYPDSTIVYQKPKATDFFCQSRSKQKLTCKLLLSHQSWTGVYFKWFLISLPAHKVFCLFALLLKNLFLTLFSEPCYIKVCIVLAHPTDIKREINQTSADDRAANRSDMFYKSFLKLSDELDIYVQPRPVTR